MTVFPSLSAVGSWEQVLSFSIDFSVPKLFGVRTTGCKFLFEKLAFAFLTDCVYWFLTSLKSCISWRLFDASAVPRAVSVLSSTFFDRGMLI